MTRIYTFLFLALGLCCFTSCNDDLELFGDIKETPVVYGLISVSADQQYIRLERSFADPETSAVVLAKDENTVYFDDVTAVLVDENDNRYPLTRVNAVDEGYVRRAGDFLTDPNYLYKVGSELTLVPDETYRIEISKNEELLASGSTICVGESNVRRPTLAAGQRRINFFPGQLTDVAWRKVDNVSNYRVLFEITVLENNSSTGQGDTKVLRWSATSFLRSTISSNTVQSTNIPGESFFSFLAGQLEENPDITRQIARIDLFVESYGNEIGNYLDIINANSGVTSAQEVPNYTNIENGLGIFSSSSVVVAEGVIMTDPTISELTTGDITKDLNFSR